MLVLVSKSVEDIQRHFQLYNPSHTLDHLSINQKEGYQTWFNFIYLVNNKVNLKLKELYKQVLQLTQPIGLVDDILSLLGNEYREVVEQLNNLGFPQPKYWFDSWQLPWMLEQIKNGILVDDEIKDSQCVEKVEGDDGYVSGVEDRKSVV